MSPEDVAHVLRGPGDELLLVHPAQLLARHREAGDEGVNVRALPEGELPYGPGQPVAHLVLAPVPGVPRDPWGPLGSHG